MEFWERKTSKIRGDSSPEVRKWFHRIDRAITKRKKFIEQTNRCENYLKRDHDPTDQNFTPQVNKTRAFVNNRLASFVYKNPRFIVRPATPGGSDVVQIPGPDGPKEIEKHRVAQHILNFVASQPSFGADRTCRRFGRGGLVSLGVSKVGYRAEFGSGHETEEKYAYDEDEGFLRDPSLPPDERDGIPGNLIPAPDEYGKGYPLQPTSEQWFWDCISADKMLFDPDGEEEFYDHDWVACEYMIPIEELKQSGEFDKKALKDVRATAKERNLDDIDEPEEDFDPDIEGEINRARIFLIHDIKHEEVIFLADGCGRVLKKSPYPRGVGHSPYVFFRPDENPGEWYPRPIVFDAVPIAREIEALHFLKLCQAKANVRKHLMRKGELDAIDLGKWQSTIPDEIVEVDTNKPLSEVLYTPAMPATEMNLEASIQRLEGLFDEVVGQPAERRAAQGASLATSVNLMAHGAQVREDDYRAQYSSALREVGKKLLDSLQANMTLPMAIQIEGDDGVVFAGEVSPEMIEGDFDVSVDVEDLMPRSTDVELANIIQGMNMFGQYPGLALSDAVSGSVLDKLHINSKPVREGLSESAKVMIGLQAPNSPDAQGGAGPVGDFQQLAGQQGGR